MEYSVKFPGAGTLNVESVSVMVPFVPESSAALSASATNAPAQMVLPAAGAGARWVVDGVVWSYAGGTPAGGNLQIKVGAIVVFSMDITTEGAGFVPVKRKGTDNGALSLVLAAAGDGVVGSVAPAHAYQEGVTS